MAKWCAAPVWSARVRRRCAAAPIRLGHFLVVHINCIKNDLAMIGNVSVDCPLTRFAIECLSRRLDIKVCLNFEEWCEFEDNLPVNLLDPNNLPHTDDAQLLAQFADIPQEFYKNRRIIRFNLYRERARRARLSGDFNKFQPIPRRDDKQFSRMSEEDFKTSVSEWKLNNPVDVVVNQEILDAYTATPHFYLKAHIHSIVASCDLSVRDTLLTRGSKLKRDYDKLHHTNSWLYSMVRKAKMLTHMDDKLLPPCTTVKDAVDRLSANLDISPPQSNIPSNLKTKEMRVMVECISHRYHENKKLSIQLSSLEHDVRCHKTNRHRNCDKSYFSMEFLGEDLAGHIFAHCKVYGAVNLLRTCKEFSLNGDLKGILPHLSVRWIPGIFPHFTAPSPESRDGAYVINGQLLHTYVDFVISGDANDKTRDILTSFEHSTPDERWDPNEVKSHICGASKWSTPTPVTDTNLRDDITKKMDFELYSTRVPGTLPLRQPENSVVQCDEVVDERRFRRRIPHEYFFRQPIRCTFDLVDAEKLQEFFSKRIYGPVPQGACQPTNSRPRY